LALLDLPLDDARKLYMSKMLRLGV